MCSLRIFFVYLASEVSTNQITTKQNPILSLLLSFINRAKDCGYFYQQNLVTNYFHSYVSYESVEEIFLTCINVENK